MDGKAPMDELQRATFRVVVAAELDQNPGGKSGDEAAITSLDRFEGSKLIHGDRGGQSHPGGVRSRLSKQGSMNRW